MENQKPPPSLEDLDSRLKQAKGISEGDDNRSKDVSDLPQGAMGKAFRLGVDMVAGVAIGSGIGYVLDGWLGTKPWMLIVFFFFGSAAGMLNVYRTATGQGMAVGYRRPEDIADGKDAENGNRD